MKSIEQQAAEVLAAPWSGTGEGLAKELSDAGLLVSERDVLCRKLGDAMEAYANQRGFTKAPNRNYELSGNGPERDAVWSAWEALAAYDAAHAPKPRFVVIPVSAAAGSGTTHMVRRSDYTSAFEGTEAECAAVCAALNALAEGIELKALTKEARNV